MRTIKKNVWKPFLFGCIGLFIATVVFAVVPFHEPGPPGTPDVVDWGRNYCEIQYTPPTNDGGSPITHYIIQSREEWYPFWKERGCVNGDVLWCTIPDLNEGISICFRVIAVNKAGQSEPSGASKFATTKDR